MLGGKMEKQRLPFPWNLSCDHKMVCVFARVCVSRFIDVFIWSCVDAFLCRWQGCWTPSANSFAGFHTQRSPGRATLSCSSSRDSGAVLKSITQVNEQNLPGLYVNIKSHHKLRSKQNSLFHNSALLMYSTPLSHLNGREATLVQARQPESSEQPRVRQAHITGCKWHILSNVGKVTS